MSTTKRRRPPTEEERAERRAAERRLMEEAIERLRSDEVWQRWLSLRRHFRDYSFRNQLLIALQCPHATRVAGFRKWLELGYAVRKGEKAIRIWAPCPPAKKAIARWREEGADPDARPRTFFRLVAVFDASQVSPLPEFPGGPIELSPPITPVEREELAGLFCPLVGFAASIDHTVAVEEVPGPALGYCSPERRHIGVEAVSDRFSANAQVSVLVHEVAHALVRVDHHDEDPRLTYGEEEEVVVECVAYTVCGALGLDTSGWSVPYMASWGEGADVVRYSELIDRLASRLEDAALTLAAVGDMEAAAA